MCLMVVAQCLLQAPDTALGAGGDAQAVASTDLPWIWPVASSGLDGTG